MADNKSSESRRKLLKSIAAGSGLIVSAKSLPESWSKPVVDSMMLPAHAQTSGCIAGVAYTNTIDPGTGFTVPWSLQFLDSTPFGYSPNAGAQSLHTNNVNSGIADLPLPNTLVPGLYELRVDVGNYDNRPFAVIGDIGLRSGTTFLVPVTSNTPTPGSGVQLTWTFTYNLSAADISSLNFAIDIPAGADQNASFDNLILSVLCP